MNPIKIFLVEDEFIVRDGIRRNVDWSGHGYEFCGDAGDGELAFPMIQKCRPDIVITDIRMPFMDGLELSRLIRRELPETEIIVLTGYEEFEYAKECIRIGVAQYLLKPVSGDDLLREVDKLAERIRERQAEKAIRERYEEEQEERLVNERKDLFRALVTGALPPGELLEQAGRLKIDLSAMWYNVLLFMVRSQNHAQDEYSQRIVELEEHLKAVVEAEGVLVFGRNLEGRALLLKAESREELEEKQERLIRKFREELVGMEKIRYFGGIGQPVNRLRELPASYEAAGHAFAHRFLMAENRILDGEGLKRLTAEGEELDLSEIDLQQLDREKLRSFLRQGDSEEAVYFVEEFFRGMEEALKSAIFRQYVTIDTYFAAAEFLRSIQEDKDQIEAPDITSESMQSPEGSIAYIIRVLRQAAELREKNAGSRYRDVVNEVLDYIDLNYADSELSLNQVAAHVNFSPNHLSTIFSQEQGQPFVKYLTDYRMNKAKELLRCTAKRSSDICLEVGYKDPHYFSYLFKKTQGMTPTQYRGGRGAEEE